jgi:hypothetical protein
MAIFSTAARVTHRLPQTRRIARFASLLACAATAFFVTQVPAPARAQGTGEPEGFDRDAVATSLASVAVQTCKRPKGPTGDGHVVITFAATGQATLAAVDRAPFQGTKVGACVAREFKKVRIPAFKGSPITIGKNFKID